VRVGVWQVISVEETTVTDNAAVVPTFTVAPDTYPVPVTVIDTPPAIDGDESGLTAVTVGTGSKLNSSAELVAEVPPPVVTVMFTVPADSDGEVATILTDESTVYVEAALEPKSTAVAPVRFVPLIVTDVPPAIGPAVGDTDVTVGIKMSGRSPPSPVPPR
jgi:hypothetical protein